jgi:hypothetical protein
MISNKTVFTHKYRVMKKFGLRSDVELRLFLIRLAEKSSAPLCAARSLMTLWQKWAFFDLPRPVLSGRGLLKAL